MALHDGSRPMFFYNPALQPFMPYPDLNLLSIQRSADMIYSPYNSENYLNKLDENLTTIWRFLQRFCSIVNHIAETQERMSARISQDTMASVMYRLLYLRFETNSVDETIRLCLLGLSYQIFLQWQDMKLPYPHFPSSFKKCLLNLNIGDGFPSDIMLWFLMVGAISGLPDDKWLKQCMRGHVDRCQVESWNEMRDILNAYMWIHLLHDKPGKHFFESTL